MVLLPSVNQKRYERNLAFYKKESSLSLGVFFAIEAVLIALTVMGFTFLPRLVAGFALTHFIILPFLFVHNFKLVMEIRYFGIKESFTISAMLFHLLLILAIEACVIFTSFVFLQQAPTWIGASGLAVSMALILLLIIERRTYNELRIHVDFDRDLYKDNIIKIK
ncbi:MAG: hypothetical protein PHT30_02065 [Bacilli bacterium]|jgi:hypothetical protein|nr:hypothetical protein [Bacilli bacterium]